MRLVLHFMASDGYTYFSDVSLPFEYESAEAAIEDFEKEVTDAYRNQKEFVFAGHRLNASHFFLFDIETQSWLDAKLHLPSIWTIDEWFENESKN